MPETTPKLEKITETTAIARHINSGLAVAWINADLLERAHSDIRRDIILYDEDKLFVGMWPSVLGPDLTEAAQRQAYVQGVRYYSNGIV